MLVVKDGIITPKGSKRNFIGEFDKKLVTELFGSNIILEELLKKTLKEIESSKRNFIGSFDTNLITDLFGENRKFVGFITSSKTDFDSDGNFIQR